MRIGVVDDDEATIAFISQVLTNSGHSCVTFRRSSDVIPALRDDTFDLLIFDWNMPELTGLDLVTWAHSNIVPCPPIIILTNRSDKEDIAMALNAGADDFIIKPESAIVIAARVDAVLRRSHTTPSTARLDRFGPYSFDRQAEHVTLHDQEIVLTSKEFALAHLFFGNLHKPLSRRYIMEKVWKSIADISTRTLDVHVSRIRSKLQLCADNGYRLETVFGFGYRLETC
ncbi:transcriptional regulator [Novosphingobium sp. AAP83]|uniref:response regulator transcription factor n=1 Tax=Novosphingobium sp. AAP83 TaxID=1523425 RepID=UPI0006B8FF11|nr:response regulator transcription factor [Novosphingobium sp. AAP83]KPF91646.1 transcriptional regulator [Novosphingobium sp. AAP83]